jgi:hypothetical protein
MVVADEPLFVGITANPLNPVLGSPVQLTATVTSAGNIPATFRWYWDWENNNTYDHTESGSNPNIKTHPYGAAGVTTVKVLVVDEVTGREATSTLDFTVQ